MTTIEPPNYRDGKCCYHCKECKSDIRCGCFQGYYCKYGEIGETGICDDYDDGKGGE